jgi:hypothetical protein
VPRVILVTDAIDEEHPHRGGPSEIPSGRVRDHHRCRDHRIRRRWFIASLGAAALTLPRFATAQLPVARLAFLLNQLPPQGEDALDQRQIVAELSAPALSRDPGEVGQPFAGLLQRRLGGPGGGNQLTIP